MFIDCAYRSDTHNWNLSQVFEMTDLAVAAPLAYDESECDDEWNDFSESGNFDSNLNLQCTAKENRTPNLSPQQDSQTETSESPSGDQQTDLSNSYNSEDLSFLDSFLEKEKSGSLEDLVKTFDKKLSECFTDGDYKKSNVSKIAPVQVRSQEDIINGCQ